MTSPLKDAERLLAAFKKKYPLQTLKISEDGQISIGCEYAPGTWISIPKDLCKQVLELFKKTKWAAPLAQQLDRRIAELADPKNQAYVQASKAQDDEGDIETDDDAITSRAESNGEEEGAYVMGWRWVSAAELPGLASVFRKVTGKENDE